MGSQTECRRQTFLKVQCYMNEKKTQLKTYKSDFFALNTLLTSQAEQFYSAQWSQMIQEVLLARYFDPPNFTKCFYPMTNLNLTSTYVQ